MQDQVRRATSLRYSERKSARNLSSSRKAIRSAWRKQRLDLKHFDETDRVGRLREHRGRNASGRQAVLEKRAAEAWPALVRGRLPATYTAQSGENEQAGRLLIGDGRRHGRKRTAGTT